MTYSPQRRTLFIASGYVCVIGLILLLVIYVAGFKYHTVLLTLMTLALIIPMGLRHISGRLDLFEPIILANIALGIMFLGRPLTDLLTGNMFHLGYNVAATFNEALLVALLGITCFQLGYFSPFGYIGARALPSPPVLRPRSASVAAWVYFIIGGLLFLVFLKQSGSLGLLFVLMEGRQPSNNELFLGSTGYFYNGILMWGASALIFFAIAIVSKKRINWLWFALLTTCLLIFYGARGSRSMMLPFILAIPLFWYLWRARRPRLRTLLLAGLVGLLLIGWLREVRTVGNNRDFVGSFEQVLTSPVTTILNIVGGADNDMFDSLANALLVVPEQVPFQHGATITDLLIRGVPRPLWPHKPLESNDAMVNALWPEHYAKSRASPAFSIIGPFYADSGLFTVALGMFLIGFILSMFWRWFQRHHSKPVAQLIYAMGLPFVIILMRGTIPGTLTRMLFLFVPLILLIWVTRLRIYPAFLLRRGSAQPEKGVRTQ
jgi:hypothetical protein